MIPLKSTPQFEEAFESIVHDMLWKGHDKNWIRGLDAEMQQTLKGPRTIPDAFPHSDNGIHRLPFTYGGVPYTIRYAHVNGNVVLLDICYSKSKKVAHWVMNTSYEK